MKDLKTLSMIAAVAGVWLIIVSVFLLSVVTVEHYALTGWIFTLLMINTVAVFAGLALMLYKLGEISKSD
jgi:hypothetical protein